MRRVKLFQFRHCPFCEKVRLVLAAKSISYSVQEVTPGIGQFELFRLSGQRQVPVLQDGAEVVAGSFAIAQYLETTTPTPPLLPGDASLKARVLLWENWADTSLVSGVRLALLQAASQDPHLRKALLPVATPGPLKELMGAIPGPLAAGMSQTLGRECRQQLHRSLEQLTVVVGASDALVGEVGTLADIAVAAHLYGLRFPESAGADLAGRGVPGIADNPGFEPLFAWRDQVYTAMGRSTSEEPPASHTASTTASIHTPGNDV